MQVGTFLFPAVCLNPGNAVQVSALRLYTAACKQKGEPTALLFCAFYALIPE